MTQETQHPCEPCPADRKLPVSELLPLGLQHVLVMYAGTIAVALIVGSALDLSPQTLSYLIMADLLCCGVGTLIQSLGIWNIGIRLPVIMGSSFVTVGPMVAMASGGDVGLAGIFGATFVSGIFGVILVPFFTRLLKFFPPVVTGTVITAIGLTLIPVGLMWAGGGAGAENFGAPINLGMAFFVLACILLINRFARGLWANIAVLLGLAIGYVLAIPLGMVDLSGLGDQSLVGIVTPLHFGMLEFPPAGIAAMCLVMIITLVESTGMLLALGEMTGKPVDRKLLKRGLYGDSVATLVSGPLNGFPHTSFSQNVGLVGLTGVSSRFVTMVSGFILVLLSLFPQAAFIVASVPKPVLGGAGLVMFGMVAAAGINITNKADMTHRSNQMVFAVSIAVGMIPLAAPHLFDALPGWAGPMVHSGILLTAVSAVLINGLLNGSQDDNEDREAVAADELEAAAQRQAHVAKAPSSRSQSATVHTAN